MPCYDNVGGVLRTVSKIFDNVGGVLRPVQAGYDNIGGVLRRYHSANLELYNAGVKDVPIGYQSGTCDYGNGFICGGWDANGIITIYPQFYVQYGYGVQPSQPAQVDFAVCDWNSRYLCMTMNIPESRGKAWIYAKDAPNGTILKELHFATKSHAEGGNSGSGWGGGRFEGGYSTEAYGFAFRLPQAGTYTICADLSLMTRSSWALSIQMLEAGWGVNYSPKWEISRIWQSDEIPPDVKFIYEYQHDSGYTGGAVTTRLADGWFDNVF